MIARIEIMHMGMSNYALAEELYADVPCQFGAGQNIAGKASTTTGMLNFWIKLIKSNTYIGQGPVLFRALITFLSDVNVGK